MSLRELAKLAELGRDLYRLHQDRRPEDVLRQGAPLLADRLLGPGAGELCSLGLQVLERRGVLPPAAVEGQYTVVGDDQDADPPPCAAKTCAALYSESRARQVARHLVGLDFGTVVILGARGSGKTALSCTIAEQLGRVTYCLGIPQRVLPDDGQWLEVPLVELKGGGQRWALEVVRNGSTLLIDDGANFFDSRRAAAAENRELGDLLRIARHKDLTALVNTQYSKYLDKSLFDASALIWKPPAMLWRSLELPELRELYEQHVAPFYAGMSRQQRWEHALVLCEAVGQPTPLHVTPPAWYGERQSKNKARA